MSQVDTTVEFIRSKTNLKPTVGIVLGSGLGKFADSMEIDCKIPYDDIPNFAPPTVEGHNGNLIFGKIGELELAVLQGRVHFYEGHSMEKVIFPVRALRKAGVETLILTNSAGGMLPEMQPAELMIITDHINMMGTNPLIGPNNSDFGPRFPDMSNAYDSTLIELMELAFSNLNLKFHKGVYAGLTGPSYETPAEIKYLQTIGAGAAGMSTVPESIAANHMGMKVAGVSCITNLAAGISPNKLSHDEVTENANKAAASFMSFLKEFFRLLQEQVSV